MSATIVSFARFQEIRQRHQSRRRVPGERPTTAPDVEFPVDEPATIVCEFPVSDHVKVEPVSPSSPETPPQPLLQVNRTDSR